MKNKQEAALKIVQTLVRAGYVAYFAGGWVRDYLLKHPSDDIDIATDAPPEVIQALFPRNIPVGIAFGVVIVVMNGYQFEVATFRQDVEYIGGRRPEKIVHSSAQEDALRRDFTINGMFYDPLADQILDFVGGQNDLQLGIVRTIGNPHERFKEDRLRMIRAIRFATRFGFHIDEETQMAIKAHAHTLFPAVAMERIWQEFQKMAKSPRFQEAISHLHSLGLLPVIFPALKDVDIYGIEERIAQFQHFPEGTPVILYLLELFPDLPLSDLLDLCQYLKVSNEESKLVEFAQKGRQLLAKEKEAPHTLEPHEWAQFYADRLFHACFDVLTLRDPEPHTVRERHKSRRDSLLPHVQRIVERKPLVTAALLQDHGIKPGPTMGLLLKEAEKLAIKHDLHEPDEIVQMLKKSKFWPPS